MNTRLPFQLNHPTFVKIPFTGRNRRFARGDHFDWKGLGVPEARVMHMFDQGYLFQKEIVAEKTSLDVLKEELMSTPMLELQKLARSEGADTTNSKEKQIELIHDNRQRLAAEDAVLMKRDRLSEEELEEKLEAQREETQDED